MTIFQKPWPPFVHAGKTFDLSHLNERLEYVLDSSGTKRTVLMSFSDHCFTRGALEGGNDMRRRIRAVLGPMVDFALSDTRYRRS
jgi:hypothetical protein